MLSINPLMISFGQQYRSLTNHTAEDICVRACVRACVRVKERGEQVMFGFLFVVLYYLYFN